jgi:hypothetical protein
MMWRSNLILHIFRDDGQGDPRRWLLAWYDSKAAFVARIAALATRIAAFAA